MQNNKYLKVVDRPGLVRDPDSKAILSTDKKALQEHREKLKAFKLLMEKTKEIDSIKKDVEEIKSLLSQLINIKNN